MTTLLATQSESPSMDETRLAPYRPPGETKKDNCHRCDGGYLLTV